MLTDQNFINIAFEIATASQCVSKQVAAVIVLDGRVLSTGYNGTPKGFINCCDYWDHKHTPEHHSWSLMYEVHAEQNAIAWAAREGIRIKGATLYCTHEPCHDCTKSIIASGISRIVYSIPYKAVNAVTTKLLADCGVEKQHLKDTHGKS